jgi:hypothetical protein
MSFKTKLAVLERDQWKCQRCGCDLYYAMSYKKNGSRKAHVHHVIYKSKGGTYTVDNLISTCWPCECQDPHGRRRKKKMKDQEFYISELRSEECQCGKTKKSKMSLCFQCYSSLPKEMQRDLYRPLGRGYEEAYDNAVKLLNE